MRKGEKDGVKSKFATVWEWNDEFGDVGRNCEKYIDKRWDENIKECCIDVTARERDEDIYFHVTYFTSKREGIGNLAQSMFDAVLSAGRDVKVYFVTVELFNSIISSSAIYRKSIEDIRNELGEFERTLANKFSNDSRIRAVVGGRKVVFLPTFVVLCELEPLSGNKMITEVNHFDLEILKGFLDLLNEKLVKKNLAKKVLGYKLHLGEVDDYEIEDMDIHDDEVVVRLERKSLKVKARS
ncbi:MAG: hypothetical protein QXF13_04595 [Thermoproteota archaeon]